MTVDCQMDAYYFMLTLYKFESPEECNVCRYIWRDQSVSIWAFLIGSNFEISIYMMISRYSSTIGQQIYLSTVYWITGLNCLLSKYTSGSSKILGKQCQSELSGERGIDIPTPENFLNYQRSELEAITRNRACTYIKCHASNSNNTKPIFFFLYLLRKLVTSHIYLWTYSSSPVPNGT